MYASSSREYDKVDDYEGYGSDCNRVPIVSIKLYEHSKDSVMDGDAQGKCLTMRKIYFWILILC